ncbi:fumarylacetoacetate hydrolase family protein (plasmid) [Sphingobium sp. SJ10-10]|uniref:fumarylacetoacetate hydrolase family protein n=1 Tax=unclassified Sphingobium TaxID=2611147 RepID=UPI002FF6C8C4
MVDGDAVTSLTHRVPQISDMIDLIANWPTYAPLVEAVRGENDCRLEQCRLHAPIERPGKICGIGMNYATHIDEARMAPPAHQIWFAKPATAVAGPFDPIERPMVSEEIDYEAELVMIIGQRCRHVSREAAAGVVFGYCVGNDVSVRDWQRMGGQHTIGKSFDTHAPFGPWIVLATDIDPHELDIKSHVNGQLRQNSNTRNMIFDCWAQIEHLSKAMTLEPGDVIYTGTPGGVGAAMKPPSFLREGDTVKVEIQSIGAIENIVVNERPTGEE